MEASNDRLVLVTGASGYVAGHVIKVLLEAKYRVRGTVRKVSDKRKYEHLLNLPGANSQTLQFVETNLTSPNGWDEACKDCAFVMHIASPFPATSVKNPETELYRPAVDGTLNVLRASLKTGVRKVVVTSSVATIWFGHKPEVISKTVFTENNWSEFEQCEPYQKSKILAERAVWDFHAQNKDKIEIAVINPAYIIGPIMSKNDSTSADIIKKLMTGAMPLPKLRYMAVDVRDVARAHLLALENPNTNGRRYLISGQTLWIADLAAMLASEFKPQGYKVSSMKIGKCPLRLVSLFNKQARLIVGQLGLEYNVDNSRSINELKLKYTPIKQSIIEMGYSLIENGVVPNKRKSK